jgi:hypothetical protein
MPNEKRKVASYRLKQCYQLRKRWKRSTNRAHQSVERTHMHG